MLPVGGRTLPREMSPRPALVATIEGSTSGSRGTITPEVTHLATRETATFRERDGRAISLASALALSLALSFSVASSAAAALAESGEPPHCFVAIVGRMVLTLAHGARRLLRIRQGCHAQGTPRDYRGSGWDLEPL